MENGQVDHKYFTIPSTEKSTLVDPISKILLVPKLVTVSDYVQNLANAVGAERTRLADIRGRAPSQDRGPVDNVRVDIDGVLCEQLYIDLTHENEYWPIYNLLASHPVKEQDIKINGVRYDCKMAHFRDGRVTINCESHAQKRASFYLIGLHMGSAFSGRNQMLLLPPIRHREISGWEIGCVQSPFYEQRLTVLLDRWGM